MVCIAGTLDPRPAGRTKVLLEGHSLKVTLAPGKCCISRCRNVAKNSKKKVAEFWFCNRCWQRRWRKSDPKRAAYRNLKDHAAGRRIPFTLSFERFVEITDRAGYWDQQPESDADRLTVDRVKCELGYHDDNVEVITKSLNVIKGNKERHLSPVIQAILARKREQRAAEAWQMTGVREDSWLDSEEPF